MMAAGGAGVGPETPIYIMVGHGYEDSLNFDKRTPLPKGYTLVTISQYGGLTYMDEVCNAIKLFTEKSNGPLLNDPRKNAKFISSRIYNDAEKTRRIHVYTAGQKIPSLHFSPVADWPNFKQKYTTFLASGLRTFPIEPPAAKTPFAADLGAAPHAYITTHSTYGITTSLCSPFLYYRPYTAPVDAELLSRLYEGAVYPTTAAVATYVTKPVLDLKKNFKISLLDLFKNGPGVYYFVICRDSQNDPAAELNNFFSFSLLSEIARERDNPDILDKDRKYSAPEYGTYVEEMGDFRGHYITERDVVVRIKYFLDMLMGYPTMKSVDGKLSDETFKMAIQFWLGKEIPEVGGFDRVAITNKLFPEQIKFSTSAGLVRAYSERQQIEESDASEGAEGEEEAAAVPPSPAGGAGGAGKSRRSGIKKGGARRITRRRRRNNKKTRRGKRKH